MERNDTVFQVNQSQEGAPLLMLKVKDTHGDKNLKTLSPKRKVLNVLTYMRKDGHLKYVFLMFDFENVEFQQKDCV